MSERDFSHVPQELKERGQWVARRGKVPYDPRTARRAKPNDPATWATFDTAVAALANGYDGVGFVFSANDPYAGVDLDHCRDAATSVIEPWALDIISELDSYTEVSPSGTGVHILVAATVPTGGNKTPYQSGAVEMYSAGRYFTVTGSPVGGTPDTIQARQDELAAVHARVFAARKRKGNKASDSTAQRQQQTPASDPPIADDAALIRLAMSASNGATFSRLFFNGDTSANGEDDSRADLALCNLLAFWCGPDPERIDRLFRRSGLMRDKWNERRGAATYGERTIAAALNERTEWYRGPGSGAGQSTGSHAEGNGASDGANSASGGNAGPAPDDTATAPPAIPYREKSHGLVWVKTVGRGEDVGEVEVLLCNFTAKITADVMEDDGAEVRHTFEIAARLHGRTSAFTVPAERFMGMGWAAEYLGATAILMPGQALRDHARAAIQLLSGADMPVRRVYQHTGWRQMEGSDTDGGAQWVYLHAGGGIGAGGMVPGVSVALDGALARYALLDPPDGAARVAAIRASLAMLDVADERVTVPIYAAIWRAVLGECDFSVHVSGASGQGKTAIAALAQQHYGAAMGARNLPGSWVSTANANEGLAFAAKDALFVVDDLVSSGTPADQQRLHRDVERLLRAQGNHAGRGRMRADGSQRPAKPPRGLILSTGEDMPRGQSLQSRVLLLDHQRGAIHWDRLTACQRDADAGTYAAALAGYVRWLAPQYDTVRGGLRAELADLRTLAAASGQHRRTPEIVANLALGIRHFTRYAVASGALSPDEATAFQARVWRVLGDVAERQGEYQAASEPAARFLALLASAISSGRAHLATTAGGSPVDVPTGRTWGWQAIETPERLEWRYRGERVGWVDGENVYLDPVASHAVAQRLGRDTDDPINVSAQMVHKRLNEQRLLASVDAPRRSLTIRRQCEGASHNVLHVHAQALYPDKKTDKTDKTSAAVSPAQEKTDNLVGFPVGKNGARNENRQAPTQDTPGLAGPLVGFVGFSDAIDSADVERGDFGDIGERALSVQGQKTDTKTDKWRQKTDKTDMAPDALERPAAGDVASDSPVFTCPRCGGHDTYVDNAHDWRRCATCQAVIAA